MLRERIEQVFAHRLPMGPISLVLGAHRPQPSRLRRADRIRRDAVAPGNITQACPTNQWARWRRNVSFSSCVDSLAWLKIAEPALERKGNHYHIHRTPPDERCLSRLHSQGRLPMGAGWNYLTSSRNPTSVARILVTARHRGRVSVPSKSFTSHPG